MRSILLSAITALTVNFAVMAVDVSSSAPVYELRVYYAPEGKLNDLNARFRDHTMKLFEKHGMKNLGYFVPEGENKDRKLIYFLEHKSREAATQSWKAFGADPAWHEVVKESEKNGRLVSKIDSWFLQRTDYSPELLVEKKGGRIFELRTYTTPEGKLEDLNARFRNHTVNLFKKHGMENLVYWTKYPDPKDANNTLIYLLAHQNVEARNKSFDAFRKDPDWIKAKAASEQNGSLTVEGGVKSEFLVPTDYSQLK